MLPIQHVRQKHPQGCVVACLSMITGVPYDDILKEFTGDRTKDGLSCFTYDVWLGYRGYALIRNYKHYSPLHADRKQWPCEPFADAHICTVNTNGRHAVVMLCDGTVLDPNEDGIRRLSNYEEVVSITGVFKVREPSTPGPLSLLHWSGNGGDCQWCGASRGSWQYHDPCPARNPH